VIKAVFFDWFHTVALFDPPRENLQCQALQEFGIELPPDRLSQGLLIADKDWFIEDNRSRIKDRSREEQLEVALRYEEIVLRTAGASASRELLIKVIEKINQLHQGITFVLFDDVLPTVKTLKKRQLVMGLISNATQDMLSVYKKLGLEPYLDFVVNSQEVGCNKPAAPIFLAALEKAGVEASEAIHVGDQYELDVVGAQGVGIKPILIDRFDVSPEFSDCPRIRGLLELMQYL